jgi:uncharacterized protein (UPF0332 family)
MPELNDAFIDKAVAALVGAESELRAGRYENVANRCYYACFQAAIVALEVSGVHPAGGVGARWSHQAVQAQFVGILINRRKLYPSNLRETLSLVSATRQKADYTRHRISEREARRALRLSQEFVEAIRSG